MARAQISSGAVSGSTSVQVTATGGDDGTTVLVYSGSAQLGTATLARGAATVTLSRSLATGEILIASVTNPGDGTGLPVMVTPANIVVNGYRTPSELNVIQADGSTLTMTVAQFFSTYGYVPASIQDAMGDNVMNWPEYRALVNSGGSNRGTVYQTVTVQTIGFTVLVSTGMNQTTLAVSNVTNQKGTVLVDFGAGFATATSATFTTNQTVNVRVKGTQNVDADIVSQSVAVTVQSAAAASTTYTVTPVPYTVNTTVTTTIAVSFTLTINFLLNSTTLTVSNVAGHRGSVQVDFGSGFGSALVATYTQANEVTVRVKGSQDADTDANSNKVGFSVYSFYGPIPISYNTPARTLTQVVTTTAAGIGFNLVVNQGVSSSTLTVSGITGITGTALIDFGSGFGNATTATYTASTSVTVRVKGSGDADAAAASRTLSVSVGAISSSATVDSRLAFYSWRDLGDGTAGFLRIHLNCAVAAQCKLSTASTWQDMISYGPAYQEGQFSPIARGAVTVQIRIAGETDNTKWASMSLVY